jgi:hypothetical protein
MTRILTRRRNNSKGLSPRSKDTDIK